MKNNYSLMSPYPLNRKAVKKRMIDIDMSVNRLIELTELGQATASRYINGDGFNPKIQQAIADALGLPLDAILLKPEPEQSHSSAA